VLTLPPLRERGDDLLALARKYLEQCCRHLSGGTPVLTPEAESAFRSYDWPGNLRELQEVVEESALRSGGAPIGIEHVPERVRLGGGKRLPSLQDVGTKTDIRGRE
jgi:transcriptional regulator with GAF, ATPase, and Fis domain